jgi:hypothetical protein
VKSSQKRKSHSLTSKIFGESTRRVIIICDNARPSEGWALLFDCQRKHEDGIGFRQPVVAPKKILIREDELIERFTLIGTAMASSPSSH